MRSLSPRRYIEEDGLVTEFMEGDTGEVKVIFCSYPLQSSQQSDTISTQVILEFHLGPEETKTVQWFLSTLYTVMG